jgi:heme-degrading monooxygenase HmoA
MYMTMRHYRVQPGRLDEVARRVDDIWLGKVRAMPGFVSYHVFKPADDELISISTFLDQKEGSAAAELSAEWVGQYLQDVELEFLEMRQGPVIIHGGL